MVVEPGSAQIDCTMEKEEVQNLVLLLPGTLLVFAEVIHMAGKSIFTFCLVEYP